MPTSDSRATTITTTMTSRTYFDTLSFDATALVARYHALSPRQTTYFDTLPLDVAHLVARHALRSLRWRFMRGFLERCVLRLLWTGGILAEAAAMEVDDILVTRWAHKTRCAQCWCR